MNWKKISWFTMGLIIPLGVNLHKVSAHGTGVNYKQVSAIEIQSKYDNGQPMSNAQIIIYAPNNPSQPWLKGMTDENGKFIFTPDYDITGNWSVKVREAGHGTIVNIPIEKVTGAKVSSYESVSQPKTLTASSQKTNDSQVVYSPLSTESEVNNSQDKTIFNKIFIALTGVWGFVGTALFFTRQKDLNKD